jgi:hypothetical protein
VLGRNCDLLVKADGHAVHWAAVLIVMMGKTEILHYQIFQPDPYAIEIRVVCKNRPDDTYFETIRKEVQPLFGEPTKISIKQLDRIELTAGGKYRVVISEVNPDFIKY